MTICISQSLPVGHFSPLQPHWWLFWTNICDIVTNKAWTSKCSLWRCWKAWRSGRVVSLKAWDFRRFWFQVTRERWGRGRGVGRKERIEKFTWKWCQCCSNHQDVKLQSSLFWPVKHLSAKETARDCCRSWCQQLQTGSLADLSSLSNVFYTFPRLIFHKSASSGNFSLINNNGKPPCWMFWAAREAGSASLPCQASFYVWHTLQVPWVFNLPAYLKHTELQECPDFPESLGLCSCDFLH